MKNSRHLRMVNRVLAKAEWKARINALDVDGCRPYVEGAPDPITGRRQGPNVDLMKPEQRNQNGVPAGLNNAQYRREARRILSRLGLPPVGLFSELTHEEQDRFFFLRDEREKLDLPCSGLDVTADQAKQCAEWHEKVERGEMTRAEYHRLARAMMGLPPEEPSSSGQAEEVASSSGG
jgi:hypothetical protein